MRSLGSTWSRVMGSALVVVALGGLAASPAAAQAKPKAKGLDIMLMQPKAVKAGANDFEVMVKGADEKPLSGADVSVLFVMPKTATMAEMRNEVKLKPSGAGMYMGSGNVMMAGTWNVTVSVKQSGKEVGHKTLALTAK
jgi:YtkA-like